ncbi:MAG: UDP-N-acetylmuramoyl-L-alanyl-D-glutamate--2,6-diaminopimelate ligase [Treponema sp.]|jgi:UDP-N-acetylmuramoyl-L-alanyl-D-glutamate--2,6-diaminopimelate ligase|nr:UDP-N-acetylmuramoyl-L-alanyl-D-glutamate--2,6-diaminopimelate ligase [Treponema sp.]
MKDGFSCVLSRFFYDNAGFFSKIGFLERKNDGDPVVTGLQYDSRAIEKGDMYFALPGAHTDGRRFIPQAVERGAVVVVHQDEAGAYAEGVVYIKVKDSRFAMSGIADAFYGSPSRKLAVIGVTGTEGKSTTVHLIWQLLRLCGKRAGFISTVQYCVADSAEWNPEHQTTPEATVIHKRLAEMVNNGLEFAVLEASSHGLSPRTNRLGDVAFDVAVMSNVTHEHLEFHGTWERYRDDKARLFRALDAGSAVSHQKRLATGMAPGFGVVNGDDKSASYFASVTQKPVFSYTEGAAEGAIDADARLVRIESASGGNEYALLETKTQRVIPVKDNLPGAFNVRNVMASLLCVSNLLSTPIADLAPLVPQLTPTRGRMTAVQKGQPFEVIVDYAHTPSSFATIFPPLRSRYDKTGGRIISVFGSAGDRDTQKRPEQGRIAALHSDIIILADEDPRGEDPMAILEEIAAGVYAAQNSAGSGAPGGAVRACRNTGTRGEDLFLIPDRPSAIRKAFSLAREGDVALLLGKGHENSILYAHETRPYDEITEAEKALEEAGYTLPAIQAS